MKIGLVTGATSKFGQLLCNYLFENDWSLILHYYNDNKNILSNNLEEYKRKGYNFTTFQADFNEPAVMIKNFEQICLNFGYPTLIINNAAYFENDNFNKFELNLLEQHLNINFKAPILMIAELAKYFLRAKEYTNFNIINILDYCVSAHPDNQFVSYSLSKMAMASATKLMAVSLAPNFRVNAIAPGPFILDSKQNEARFRQSVKDNPLNYELEAEEILLTIDFLIKNQAITGEVIHIDGGRNLVRSEYY